MLTQKTRYAMLSMVRLSRNYGEEPLTINTIAESEMIPKRFLEAILLELKKNGYLGSRLGKSGGYYLVKKPKDISLLEIIRLFEGSIAWLACTSEKYYKPCEHCKEEATCSIRLTFKDIREYTFNKLAGVSFADLIATPHSFAGGKSLENLPI
ncbi:MAG: Rrf2 family transcriptional regulator [Bacteroidota bacterium]|nr:Rrf2 family transcriptional regulator [Bacteroidota bacterium]MDP4225124.1 Rrf2 family transcriptional regulator [Bacteroidota bacterium]MDP4273162.1 Rrf2 family transcriptional regulator [Bacteroidota bacterium]